MSIEHIASEALRLPPRQRAMLAESLWESLSDPYQTPAGRDDADTLKVAAERDRQLEAGEVQTLSHEEMMSRLRRWVRWSVSAIALSFYDPSHTRLRAGVAGRRN